MIAQHIAHSTVRHDCPVFEAFWHFSMKAEGRTLFVVNDQDLFVGTLSHGDFHKLRDNDDAKLMKVDDICNTNPKVCYEDGTAFMQAANLCSSYPTIMEFPVITEKKDLVDCITREDVMYAQYYLEDKLPRMHYAKCMSNAVILAKSLDIKHISVIEFGVAAGQGLLNCEFHAKNLERLHGVKIDIYGFDTGGGLPSSDDWRDVLFRWSPGLYSMKGKDILEKRLVRGKLILGDIASTRKSFFTNPDIAPIGAFLVDVDFYTSTVEVLKFLFEADSFFLPRIYSYFDDIFPTIEETGMNLAIKEFNQTAKDIIISPVGSNRMKLIHRVKHPLYNTRVPIMKSIPGDEKIV